MIAWFLKNGVAANLLMGILILGGLASLSGMRVQMFPDFDLDVVTVNVAYPGSDPEEVERSVVMRIEEEIQDLEGIKKITSRAAEGVGSVSVEVESSADVSTLLNEIKVRVDSLSTFPEAAEKPVVEKLTLTQDVINISLYGQADALTLKRLAEDVREDLLQLPGITQVILRGARAYEISINVSEAQLRKYGLTFNDVAQAVRSGSVDIPGGTIKAAGGEVLVRSVNQAYGKEAFAAIPLRSEPGGTHLTVGDVAQVTDGFEDAFLTNTYKGQPSSSLTIMATRNQNVIDISQTVRDYVEQLNTRLPQGLSATAWGDISFYLKGRLNMLYENGAIGLLLVFAFLTLFLRPSLAVWVAVGIPVSFMGTFIVLGIADVSINIISLFGFIMVLGIVVDDAIVVGESVFTHFQKYGPGRESALKGAEAVAMPVTFAILTTMVAFLPIFFIPGFQGKFLESIPYVVIAALFFSLIETKLILPYHLSLCKVGGKYETQKVGRLARMQRGVATGLETFIAKYYRPFLAVALRARYITLAVFLACFALTITSLKTGWVRFVFQPDVPSDYIQFILTMNEGTPAQQTQAAMQRAIAALHEVEDMLEAQGKANPIQHWTSIVGAHTFAAGPGAVNSNALSSNYADMMVEMQRSEDRVVSAPEFAKLWREQMGPIPGLKNMKFIARAAAAPGDPIDLQLSGENPALLRKAADELKGELRTYAGVFDVRDNDAGAKREIKLKLKPAGAQLGLTQAELGRQVRAAFYGEEAQRVQRGRNEVKVMVRYPEAERTSVGFLENLRVRVPSVGSGMESGGGITHIPLSEVAEVTLGQGQSTINRVNRQRVINVTADVDQSEVDIQAVRAQLEAAAKNIVATYPGVNVSVEGEAREQAESLATLGLSAIAVLFIIYALMAIPFKSYTQPFIVMAVIPFGLMGAVAGHVLWGKDVSFLSLLGCLALAGVLVNDSLVLVDYINRQVRSGINVVEAVWEAGAARFRPILLTSLTTFVGLAPILLERSLQAQFLIPMALSLAFGVLLGTLITLILVPASYLILNDIKQLFGVQTVRK